MKNKNLRLVTNIVCLVMLIGMGCNKDSNSNTSTTTATVPAVFKKFATTVVISSDGNFITLKSNGVPDHKSCYFATSDSRYEAYNGSNPAFNKNPNSIGTKSFVFKIPANPTLDAAHQPTPLGPIGIAVNGVAIYNYALVMEFQKDMPKAT